MPRQLPGMVTIITGASDGIGAALARHLAGAGGRLVLNGRRRERLEALAATLPGTHTLVAGDVADPATSTALVEAAVTTFGRLDTVVANAGYGLIRRVEDTTAADWQAILATNLLGTTHLITAALPTLRRQPVREGWRGQVMIVSSALARRGRPEAGAYSATKAAQLSIAEALRVELTEDRIAVTSVHPIATATGFVAAAEGHGGTWAKTASEPVQTPEVVARAMAAAILRPRAEVWPHALSRWGLGLGTLWPTLFDRYFLKRMQQNAACTATSAAP